MATETASSPETVADLIETLGGIPLERVRMKRFGAAIERDVIAVRKEPERRLCELVDKVLVEIAYDFRASVLSGAMGSRLMGVVMEESKLGIVVGSSVFVQLRPGLVRIPNVGFYTWKRLGGKVPDVEILRVVPDLVADVFRRGNTEAELARKRREYFDAGVRLVWLIRPENKSAEVFHSPTNSTLIPPTGSLDGEDVAPGFDLPLTALYRYLSRRT